jgi:two-component system CheB/CheR fusion protein
VEDAVRESEARLKSLAENVPSILMRYDRRRRVVYLSPQAEAVTAVPVARFLGKTNREVGMPEALCSLWEEAIDQVFRTGESRDLEFVFPAPGEPRTFYLKLAPEQAADGSVEHVLGISTDITNRKRAEEALAAAKAALERAGAAKDQFIANLSHELRTPLTPAVAALSTLAHDPRLPEDLREDLGLVERNIGLEVHLINDLLDVTRIVNGKLALVKDRVDVAEVVRDVGRIVAGDLDAKGQTLAVEAPGAPHWVDADRARLHQVFWNLVKNAIKFSPEGARIAVEAEAEGGQVRVAVRDPGVGIEAADLPRLFRAFEQGAGSPGFGGLGLGLVICKGVVELHGGTIAAESAGRGRGATFIVRLPSAAAVLEPAATPAPSDQAKPAARALRILLVEDHADTARMLARLLQSKGHVVTRAGSVAAALEAARAAEFDVLVSDLGLPDGSGDELMRRLLTEGKRLRGIAVSGYGGSDDVQRSLEAGFTEHITKPVSLDALNQALLRAVGGRGTR